MTNKLLSFEEYERLTPEQREIVRLELAADEVSKGGPLYRLHENARVEGLIEAARAASISPDEDEASPDEDEAPSF